MSDWTSPTPTPAANMALIDRVKQLCHDVCSAPVASLSKTTGGALSAGAVNVRVSALTEFGETLPCTRVSITAATNDKVTVTIGKVPRARGYRVYASAGTGTETYQADVAPGQSATVTLVISAIASGAAMPTTDTATVHIAQASYAQAVTAALLEYSGNYPTHATETKAQTTGTYEYDLPADWDYGLSTIELFEYPSGEEPPEYLDGRSIYVQGAHWRWSPDWSPATGKSAKLYYTRPVLESEIPPTHFDAVGLLAAATAAETIATRYAHESNSVIGADSVDYKMRASDFNRQAKVYREAAWRALGTPDGRKPHSAVATWGWKESHQATPDVRYKIGDQLARM